MGIYNKANTESVATGAANVPATLFSENVAGGSVGDGNALRFDFDFTYIGTADLAVKLGTKQVYGANAEGRYELYVGRSGQSNAVVWGVAYTASGVYRIPPQTVVGGLNWSQGQTFTAVGTANSEGGLVLQRAGLMK